MRTELQNKVVKAAKERIKNKPWYKGICCDALDGMTDEVINDCGFNDCVGELVLDTMFWDCPFDN